MYDLKQKGVTGVITFSYVNSGLSVATTAGWLRLNVVVVIPKNNNPFE